MAKIAANNIHIQNKEKQSAKLLNLRLALVLPALLNYIDVLVKSTQTIIISYKLSEWKPL